MYDKIKVSLPQAALELIKKDAEDFKILKENGKPNLNGFINGLILNYYEEFSAHEESLHDEIRSALSGVPEFYREKAFNELIKIFAKRNQPEEKSKSATLSFKPTKNSERAVVYVENALLSSESLSSFYRRMFIAYSQKTKNEREKIIHAENFAELQKAIKKNRRVCITLQTGKVLNGASVHSVSASRDELFNYVLVFAENQNHTVRLARVRSVSLTAQTAFIPEKNKILFDRQAACAPQYPMYGTDNQPIRVQLTEKGKALFNKIYLYRPTPISIDGDIYTFDCSANQLLYYFERFGDSALIISPKRLGIYMRNYYHFALKKYRSVYKTD